MSDEVRDEDLAPDPQNAASLQGPGSRSLEADSDAGEPAPTREPAWRAWRGKGDAEVRHALSTLRDIENREERVAILNEAHARGITPERAARVKGRVELTPGLGIVIFLLFLGGQLALGFVGGLLLGGYFALQGDLTDAELVLVMGELTGMIGMVCSLVAGLTLLAWIRAIRARAGGNELEGAIGWVRLPAQRLLQGAAVGVAIACAYLLTLALGVRPSPEFEPGPVAQMASSSGWQQAVWGAFAIGLAPLIEEFLFRGVLYAAFAKFGPVLACASTSLLFVGLHVGEIAGFWFAALPIASLSVAAFVARRASGSIAMSIAMHVGYNVIIVSIVYLGSYLRA